MRDDDESRGVLCACCCAVRMWRELGLIGLQYAPAPRAGVRRNGLDLVAEGKIDMSAFGVELGVSVGRIESKVVKCGEEGK